MLAPTLQKREGGAKGEKRRGETGRKNARGGNTEKKRKSQVSGKWKRKGLEYDTIRDAILTCARKPT